MSLLASQLVVAALSVAALQLVFLLDQALESVCKEDGPKLYCRIQQSAASVITARQQNAGSCRRYRLGSCVVQR